MTLLDLPLPFSPPLLFLSLPPQMTPRAVVNVGGEIGGNLMIGHPEAGDVMHKITVTIEAHLPGTIVTHHCRTKIVTCLMVHTGRGIYRSDSIHPVYNLNTCM